MKKRILHKVGVSIVLFDDNGNILFVSPDNKKWVPVAGHLENETIKECIYREINEELGDIDCEYVDVIDAHCHNHDDMLVSIWTIVKYNGGDLSPSDDIKDWQYKWFDQEELSHPKLNEILKKVKYTINEYLSNPNHDFYKTNYSILDVN